MRTTFIYGLVDPRDNKIKYIGKSDEPKRRLSMHLNWRCQPTSKKSKWIKELVGLGLEPTIRILEEVSETEWEKKEIEWIEKLSQNNQLVNGTRGGKTLYTRRLNA